MNALRIIGPGVAHVSGFPYVDAEGPKDMGDLRVVSHPDGYLVSFWQPTEEERERIAAGLPIMLWIMGGQPPVGLTVAHERVAVEA